MTKPHLHPLHVALVAMLTVSAHATTDSDQEYRQVRKIALKDAKVRAAFDKAYERLNAKMIEIDPTLKQRVESIQSARAEEPERPMPPRSHSKTAGGFNSPDTRHIVLKGETLGSIARHYKVNVSKLKEINSIEDERKLRVGQSLAIPSTE